MAKSRVIRISREFEGAKELGVLVDLEDGNYTLYFSHQIKSREEALTIWGRLNDASLEVDGEHYNYSEFKDSFMNRISSTSYDPSNYFKIRNASDEHILSS